ncbi:ricin-type beta-trefoil lectin domain protein [Kitasatospora sp. NPDC050543]|uniref:ricin-type beta-trefoil lectin domain protein n=1 Tax=Kitasatospora sp. NPDC050543 TaxID=3364054 RepID=UPI0037AE9AF0
MSEADAAHSKDRPSATAAEKAIAEAKATNKPVPINELTDEFSETVATPAGHFSKTQHPDQQRVKQNGIWVTLDESLVADPRGGFTPKASAAGVHLSAGGSGALGTLTSPDGKTLTIDSPFPLTTPTVDGNALLYPNVAPGIDLRATATKYGGLSTVLIVKTASAAANPQLKTVHFGTKTDGVTIKADADHNLSATAADGTLRWHAPAPQMWDSSTAAASPQAPVLTSAKFAAQAAPAALSAEPSPEPGSPGAPTKSSTGSAPDGPGKDAKSAVMPTTVTKDGIDLTPNQDILGKGQGPWYIDPGWIYDGRSGYGWTWTQQAYPTTNNYLKTPDNGGDKYSHPGVGYQGYQVKKGIERAFFQIDTQGFGGAVINKATMSVWEYESADFSCTTAYPLDLYLANAPIGYGTTWNNAPGHTGGSLGRDMVPGSGAKDCHDNIEFKYNVTSAYQGYATTNPWLTFTLESGDESNALAFKRLDYKPYVVVEYDRAPNTPTNPNTYPTPHTASPSRYTQGCDGADWGWLGAGSDIGNVTLNATVSSPAQGQLYSWSHIWDYNLPGAPNVADGYSALVSNGSNASFTVRGDVIKDGHLYGYGIHASDQLVGMSASTPTCRFGVDLTPPTLSVPNVYDQIAEKDLSWQFPPSGNGQNSGIRTWQTGYIPYTPSDPAPAGGSPSGVACVRWGWDPQLSDASWQCGNAMPKNALPVVAGRWGTNIIYIQVQDDAGNVSPVTNYAFYVAWNPDGPPPVFGDVSGDGAPDILAPDQAGNLRAYNVPGNSLAKSPMAALAAKPADSPTGQSWGSNIQVAHRGALTGGKNVDDLMAHPAGDKDLFVYGNPGNTGYPGRFDSKATLAKPECVTPPGDSSYCTGYASDWSTTLRIAALGDPAHTDLDYRLKFKNQTGLLTVESIANGANGVLWFYPSLGARKLGPPVRLAAGGWKDFELIAPGDWAGQGHPGLWMRNLTNGEVWAYTFNTGTLSPTDRYGNPLLDDFGKPVSVPTLTGIATSTWIGNVPVGSWPVLGSDGDLTGNGAPALWGRNSDGGIHIWWGHRTGDAGSPGFAFDAGPVKVADTGVGPNWWALDGKTEKVVDSSAGNALNAIGGPGRTGDHNNVANAAAALNGGSYYRTSQSPGIDTSQSYSVAAWVKLNNAGGYQTALSLVGNQRSPFYLQYSAAYGTWSFTVSKDDNLHTDYYAAHDREGVTPAVGVWTHLVGTYNAETGNSTLYVNGRAVGSSWAPRGWKTDGALNIGMETTRQLADTSGLNGAIGDVRTYPYALTGQQADNLATANSRVQVRSAYNTGKCVDDFGGDATGGAIALHDCWNGENQHFTFTADNTMTVYGRCVGTVGNGTANGTQLVLRDCNPAEGGQEWQRRYDGSIYNPQSGRCLELPGWATDNGTRLGIWDCTGGPNQRWFLTV